MPIVSSLVGKPYNESNFERIADALINVGNVENVKNVLKCENNLWSLSKLEIDWALHLDNSWLCVFALKVY